MASTDWKGPEPIAIAQLGEQQAELDRLLRRLVGTLAIDPGGALPAYRLGQLVEQTSQHFEAEEAFLLAMGYPDLLQHRAEHERIVQRLREELLRLEAPEAPPLAGLVAEYTQLTAAHREMADRAFTAWLPRG
jgi:hypothetical protein